MFGKSRQFSLGRRSDKFAPFKECRLLPAYPRALDRKSAESLHTASGQSKGIVPIPVDGYAMGGEGSKPADIKIHINGDVQKKELWCLGEY